MNKSNSFPALLLPCLRGQVEDWMYYVTLVPYSEISKRFKPATEIHHHATLNELLQRALTSRSGEISDYIVKQKQHFFNAIIAGIYEGEPRWVDVQLRSSPLVEDKSELTTLSESIGVLELNGQEKIFAIDGQHRVEGIKRAIEHKPRHGTEEGVVIFVAHNGNARGLERTRRLFSTLNRYAKPVKLGEIVALDEDDGIAILTRRLLYHHPLLKQEDVIIAAKTKAIPQNNTECWTSIQSLYDFLERILLKGKGMSPQRIREFKRFRLPKEELDDMYDHFETVLNTLLAEFRELRDYSKRVGPQRATGQRGGKDGGSLLFRPVGLSILGEVLATSAVHGLKPKQVIRALSKVNRRLSSVPWRGLLYDASNARMRPRVSASDVKVGARLWLRLAKLPEAGSLKSLVSEYAGAMGVEKADAEKYIRSLPKQ